MPEGERPVSTVEASVGMGLLGFALPKLAAIEQQTETKSKIEITWKTKKTVSPAHAYSEPV